MWSAVRNRNVVHSWLQSTLQQATHNGLVVMSSGAEREA